MNEENEGFIEDDNPNDENLVEETPESVDNTPEVEEPQEEVQKTYTQEDVDKILEARTNSLNRKHQKEIDKYRETESILKQGLNAETIDDINKQLSDFYKGQGVEIKESSIYNDRDERILAQADINEIISFGDGEVIDTARELANKRNRTVREEAVYQGLMREIGIKQATEQLSKSGADKSIYESDGFKTFASKFNSDVAITDIYSLYTKTLPQKKQPESTGSMKSLQVDNVVKDFYTPEEARKFTNADYDKNPALFEAVCRSMEKWQD